MGRYDKRWERIGVTIVSKRPVGHSSGIYVRIPKNVASAYELYNAENIEIRIVRVKRPESEEENERKD